jgi:(p)ppGpp synthase/HD superfamily hydrolase
MTLGEAIKLASRHHEGQLDKGGQPYILHPLAVMFKLIEAGITNETYLKVAVLHDVAEDTTMIEQIDKWHKWHTLTAEEKEALDLLNHKADPMVGDLEDYQNYINAISNNEIATKVKIADLRHNLDLNRIIKVNEDNFNLRRINKYLKALKTLEEIDAQRGQK